VEARRRAAVAAGEQPAERVAHGDLGAHRGRREQRLVGGPPPVGLADHHDPAPAHCAGEDDDSGGERRDRRAERGRQVDPAVARCVRVVRWLEPAQHAGRVEPGGAGVGRCVGRDQGRQDGPEHEERGRHQGAGPGWREVHPARVAAATPGTWHRGAAGDFLAISPGRRPAPTLSAHLRPAPGPEVTSHARTTPRVAGRLGPPRSPWGLGRAGRQAQPAPAGGEEPRAAARVTARG
jgi:hypothetical protein